MVITGGANRALLTVPQLYVPNGETLLVRGPSGAGKSTLLFALSGLMPVASGSLKWGSQELFNASKAALARFRRRSFGIIFQDHLLFDELPAGRNAALSACYTPRPRRKAIHRAAEQALTEFHVPWQDRRDVSRFSGGERQRIAVARALASDPPVILADEPTASLDRSTANRLIAELTSATKQGRRTLIVVSHDPAFLEVADQVVTIEDGKVKEHSA